LFGPITGRERRPRAERIARLEREMHDLRRANDILKAASVFFSTELGSRPRK
jgi:transposase